MVSLGFFRYISGWEYKPRCILASEPGRFLFSRPDRLPVTWYQVCTGMTLFRCFWFIFFVISLFLVYFFRHFLRVRLHCFFVFQSFRSFLCFVLSFTLLVLFLSSICFSPANVVCSIESLARFVLLSFMLVVLFLSFFSHSSVVRFFCFFFGCFLGALVLLVVLALTGRRSTWRAGRARPA